VFFLAGGVQRRNFFWSTAKNGKRGRRGVAVGNGKKDIPEYMKTGKGQENRGNAAFQENRSRLGLKLVSSMSKWF